MFVLYRSGLMYDLIIQYWDWYLLISFGAWIKIILESKANQPFKNQDYITQFGRFLGSLIMAILWPVLIVFCIFLKYF